MEFSVNMCVRCVCIEWASIQCEVIFLSFFTSSLIFFSFLFIKSIYSMRMTNPWYYLYSPNNKNVIFFSFFFFSSLPQKSSWSVAVLWLKWMPIGIMCCHCHRRRHRCQNKQIIKRTAPKKKITLLFSHSIFIKQCIFFLSLSWCIVLAKCLWWFTDTLSKIKSPHLWNKLCLRCVCFFFFSFSVSSTINWVRGVRWPDEKHLYYWSKSFIFIFLLYKIEWESK